MSSTPCQGALCVKAFKIQEIYKTVLGFTSNEVPQGQPEMNE